MRIILANGISNTIERKCPVRLGLRKTFHVVGLPHTKVDKQHFHCAFTSRIYNFCKAMMSLGHTVYLYAPEGSSAPCTEFIPVMTTEEQHRLLGVTQLVPLTPNVFWPGCKPAFACLNAKTIEGIKAREGKKDFICIIGGHSQKDIADAFPHITTVEFGIGYSGTFAKFRVFDSYSWMHTVYGSQDGKDDASRVDGKAFDAVIGHLHDPEDFKPSFEKSDYFLYIGRLTHRKGYQLAADVCKHLGVKLIVAGAEGDPPSYGEYVGLVGLEEKAKLMANAKAVFTPTQYIGPFENTHVEAMLCGTPVITTDWGVFTETVQHGVTGFRCRTFGEFVQAAQNCHKLSPEEIRLYAVDNFSIDRVKWQYEAYFDQLLELWHEGFYTKAQCPYDRYGKRYVNALNPLDSLEVNNLPFVSCWCPTYGRVECLKEAIQSFLNQDYKGPKELVILNDYEGQTLHLPEGLPDNIRLINVKEKIKPLGKKFNETIKLCKGDVLVCWDDDDIYLPNRISYSVANMPKGVMHTRYIITEDAKGHMEVSAIDHVNKWPVAHPTHAFTRELFDEVGGYTESDWVGVDQLFMRKLEAKFGGVYDQHVDLDDIFIIYRFGVNGIYNTSDCNIMSENTSDIVTTKLEEQVKNGVVPTGDIVITPGWKHDYVGIAKKIVEAHKIKMRPTMQHIYQRPEFGENWFTYPKLYSELVARTRDVGTIVEVGSWKGKSTAYLGVEVVNSGKKIKVFAVDTWKGSEAEAAHQNDPYVKSNTLYDLFVNNIAPINQHGPIITPFQCCSTEAAKHFTDKSLDCVFIDASHQYQDVCDDIAAWLPKVKPGGILAGHDYYGWPEVRRAVDDTLVHAKGTSEDCWIYEVL